MTTIDKLKHQIYMLKLENKQLREKLRDITKEWAHPNSCLHNEDPWKTLINSTTKSKQ